MCVDCICTSCTSAPENGNDIQCTRARSDIPGASPVAGRADSVAAVAAVAADYTVCLPGDGRPNGGRRSPTASLPDPPFWDRGRR